jgi:hypothetical protein
MILKKIMMIAFVLFGALASFHIARQIVTVTAQTRAEPFTLERTIFTADDNGKLLQSGREFIARRSDGATARRQSIGPRNESHFLNRVLFPDGRSVVFVEDLKAKITWPKADAETLSRLKGWLAHPPKDCGLERKYAILKNETVLGLDTIVAQRSIDNEYRVTRWIAPHLGCEDIKYVSEKYRADGTTFISGETRIVLLSRGEPETRYFPLVEEYTELKPSEVQRMLQEKLKMQMSPDEAAKTQKQGELADTVYQLRKD